MEDRAVCEPRPCLDPAPPDFHPGEVAKVTYLQVSVNDSIQTFTSALGRRTPDRRETMKTCSLPQPPPEPAPIWCPQPLQVPRMAP